MALQVPNAQQPNTDVHIANELRTMNVTLGEIQKALNQLSITIDKAAMNLMRAQK